MYADDNDGHFPTAWSWMNRIFDYTKNESLCRDYEGVSKGGYGYAFRSSASSLSEADIASPPHFVLIFDSILTDRNASSEPWSLPNPGRHHGLDSIAFADGHAKQFANPSFGISGLDKILRDDSHALDKP